jgi:hypothetical protein
VDTEADWSGSGQASEESWARCHTRGIACPVFAFGAEWLIIVTGA